MLCPLPFCLPQPLFHVEALHFIVSWLYVQVGDRIRTTIRTQHLEQKDRSLGEALD